MNIEQLNLIWRVFQAIEKNEEEHELWNLMDQITAIVANEGVVYMTYAGETPQSLSNKWNRDRLSQLIELHKKLTILRARFSS